jgi:putative tryptophan/tyrosine transport system substrate-binding protein
MKIKWYLFFLSILTASLLIYNFFDYTRETPTRIGVLMVGDSRYDKLTGLKSGLRDLGYKQNEIQFVLKNAHENSNLLLSKIQELVSDKPDLIVTLGAIETTELKKYMDKNKVKIPVVFAGIASPKEIGLIQSYKIPGGEFTGINNDQVSISGKRLEILHDLIPSIKRVQVLYDKSNEISRLSLKETIAASKKLSIPIQVWDVSDPGFKEGLQTDLTKNDALFLLPGFRIENKISEWVQLANKRKLPIMGIYEHEVKKGILASYGASLSDQGYQSARFVSLILKGNLPSDLPVELPDSIRLIVNKNQIQSLGVTVNRDLLYIADLIGTDKKEGSDDNAEATKMASLPADSE